MRSPSDREPFLGTHGVLVRKARRQRAPTSALTRMSNRKLSVVLKFNDGAKTSIGPPSLRRSVSY
jgi:hypothetical protein